MRYHEGLGSHIFDLLNYLLLGSFAMLIVLPLMYVFLAAFATNAEIDRGAILPMKYTFDAFRAMLKMPHFLDSYWISIKLTAVGRAFRAFRAIQNLTERADRMTVQIQIQAESDQGFDALWLRNAVEEPLDEADIDAQTSLG